MDPILAFSGNANTLEENFQNSYSIAKYENLSCIVYRVRNNEIARDIGLPTLPIITSLQSTLEEEPKGKE